MPADPLEELRLPDAPIAPREAFAAELRSRLEAALRPERAPDPDTTVGPAPELGVSPYLCVSDAAGAIDFYRLAFGAVETMRLTGDDGRVGHAELTIGGTTVMVSDEYPEFGVVGPRTLGGTPVTLYLHVGDVDATYARAVAGGAQSEREPSDQFHGNRNAIVRDPDGHRWLLTQPIEQLTAEEMARRSPDPLVAASPSAATGPVPELGYFTLSAPDVDRAAAFYGALFGWQFEPARPGEAGDLYRHVANTVVPFGFHSDMADRSPHHYYRVEDLAAAVARVRDLGGEVLDVAEYASGGSARCRDDQGVEFDLWQPAPGY